MNQRQLIEALRSPAAYPHETRAIAVVETHISYVVLTGIYAYKLKKAVELPFVDFSTLDRRERYCRDELELNRRLAPELYLDVVPIGERRGRVSVGARPALEYAVKMQQFDADATADRLVAAGGLTEAHFASLGDAMASFHDALAALPGSDPAKRTLANLAELEDLTAERGLRSLEGLATRLRVESERLAPIFAARAAGGFVRDCHGDLHLGNLASIEDRLVAFDCLEFDATLRAIDVADEIAFLVMDLEAHDRADLAFAFLNGYLEAACDYEGLRLLRYYGAHRALVRAKVAVLGADAGEPPKAARYLDAAAAETEPKQALLVIGFGLSGSGKTTVARGLARAMPAVHLRSDVLRKHLHGLGALERSGSAVGSGLYTESASGATYDALRRGAKAALEGGFDAIVDASFLAREQRDRFRELAEECGAGFAILACTAREQTLRERIEQRLKRGSDASEADLAVLDHQLATMDALADDEREAVLEADTETEIDFAALAREALKHRCRRPRTGP